MKNTEDLASAVKSALNKDFKENITAYFLDDEELSPTQIIGFISTGSSMLDLIISNKPNGGIPLGRITEINGLPSTGKSLVGAHILAEVQKMGGYAIFIDTENATSMDFLEAIGVDLGKMMYCPVETLEKVYELIESIIVKIREVEPDAPVAILVDTISAVSTENELAGDFNKEGWATDKAIINSKAMRKLTNIIGRERIAVIFTTQLRAKLNAMFSDPYTTSGGWALPYHASVRIRLKNLGRILDKNKDVIGMKTECKIIKNRLGPPLRTAVFHLFFESGIDDLSSWITTLSDHKIIKSGGAWYTYIDKETGEEIKFMSKTFEEVLNKNPGLKEKMYNELCELSILKYKNRPPSLDEITIDTSDPDGAFDIESVEEN